MREENRRLKEGVARLVDALTGSESAELLQAVSSLARDAGVSVDSSKQQQQEEVELVVEWGQCATKSSTDKSSSSSLLLACKPQTPPPPPPSSSLFGAWFDPLHYIRLSSAPADLLPYLGPGATTFAGRLFWWGLEQSAASTTALATIQRGLAHSDATRAVPLDFILQMAAARLEYRRSGSIGPPLATTAGEADLAGAMRDGIEAEYRARGRDLRVWLTCVGVERYVRMLLGDERFGWLERVEKGEGGDERLVALWEQCRCRLYATGVCFGDGPRWHVQTIHRLFLGWMSEAVRLTSPIEEWKFRH